MSTNYRVTTPKQFFNKTLERENQNSLFDQLSGVLKNSLHFVWNYVKTIDVKGSIQKGLQGEGIGMKQPKLGIANNNKKPTSNNIESHSHLQPHQQHINPQSYNHINKQSLSKRQKLKQKKQRKRISFQQYENYQQKKINQSFIRKNIEIKKALNKSIQSVVQSALHQQEGQQLGNVLVKNQQNGDICNRLLLQKQHQLFQLTQQKVHNQKQNNNVNNNNNINNNNNESLILNISDIDSDCNFNILNNSNLNQSSSLIKDQHLRAQFFRQGQQEDDGNDGMGQGRMEMNVPKLQLREYPFLGHAARVSYRAKHGGGNANSRYDSRKGSIVSYSKSKNNNNNNNNNNYNKSKQKISTTFEQQQHDQFDNDYIDVDALYYPPLEHNPKKRIAAPFIKSNQTEIRKRVKHNQQQQIISQGQKITVKMLQKQQKFDRLVASRYEKIIETLNQQKQEDRQQRLTLKQEYEKFLQKNFAPANFIKRKLEKQESKLIENNKEPAQKLKFSQYLKQVDMTPQIERKKFYSFTKQCESKISVRQQLKKSVLQDKQKQYMQEMRRKQEQEMRRKRSEEQLRRRQLEEEMRRRQEEERIQRQKQQQDLKLAQQIKRQQSQTEQVQNDENKPAQVIQQQPQQTKPLEIPQKTTSEAVVISPKADQSKQNKQNQPAKSFSLFDAPKTSLFSLAQKKPSQQKLPQKPLSNEKVETNQDQLTKKPSFIEGKSAEEIKVKQIPQVVKPVELVPKPSETEPQKKPQPVKHNPFLASIKPSTGTLGSTILQNLIKEKKDDASVFKTITASTPITTNSPQRQPQSLNLNSFQSPIHNTSQYSNLDSSMCEQSQSNITPGNSQLIQNNVLPGNNLNGSFLNASFSSHTGSVFPGNNATLFGGPTPGSSGMFNTSGFNVGQAANGLFGNAQSQAPTGGLFGNQPQQQSTSFMSAAQSAQAAKLEAINKVPSFMQNQPSLLPSISPQAAVNLFSQRSPSKNEPQISLFGPTPTMAPKPPSSRRNNRKQQRIR